MAQAGSFRSGPSIPPFKHTLITMTRAALARPEDTPMLESKRRGARKPRLRAVAAAACSLVCAVPAVAQTTPGGQVIVITGTRIEERAFDVPAAIDAIGGDIVRDQQMRVNLSETLGRVPGLLAQNRHNYAQDLQVSSRGFGARATFGVRGVRLLQDGIPITMPDGQGQTSLFDLDAAERIEVLRGPFAALYGNSSGGVIHLITQDPPAQPTVEGTVSGGSWGTWRAGVKFGASTGRGAGGFGGTGNVSRFHTDGYRDHASAVRDTANAKLRLALGEATTATLIANALRQPDTADPLGLTQEQLDANRRQAGQNAVAFDTRKSIEHTQAGLVLRHRLSAEDTVQAMAYGGQREVEQYLGIPLVAQGATSSGGLVNLDRDFNGGSLEWVRRTRLGGREASFHAGVSRDAMTEQRTGRVNNAGVAGELRRDEEDRVTTSDVYAMGSWQATDALRLTGGVRRSDVKFTVADRYIVGPNPDDSGRADYSATSPVVGAVFKLTPTTNLFASAGRGFETPTFVELAYRPDGSPGPNFDLQAARSKNVEVGVRTQLREGARATVTAFRSDTRDEVVSAFSSGGRNTFTNAERTRRQGLELSAEATLGRSFDVFAAYTLTEATFRRYVTFAGVDLSGNRIPGVPRHLFHAEAAWRDANSGLSAALELRAAGQVPANDANTAAAESYEVLNLRGGWRGSVAGWTLDAFVRIENLLDEEYVGSVIVNEANQRYYEPAPERGAFVGVSLRRAF
jgi:iron complex outermembrane receptor protein